MKSEVSHVWLRPENKNQLVLTVDEFLDHDPEQRASWILGNTCSFLTPEGTCVPLARALDQLRDERRDKAGFPYVIAVAFDESKAA